MRVRKIFYLRLHYSFFTSLIFTAITLLLFTGLLDLDWQASATTKKTLQLDIYDHCAVL
jgi:hypothetical protein